MDEYYKKKKAAIIAVAYYIEQEKAVAVEANNTPSYRGWWRTGKQLAMSKRQVVQRRGRSLHNA